MEDDEAQRVSASAISWAGAITSQLQGVHRVAHQGKEQIFFAGNVA